MKFLKMLLTILTLSLFSQTYSSDTVYVKVQVKNNSNNPLTVIQNSISARYRPVTIEANQTQTFSVKRDAYSKKGSYNDSLNISANKLRYLYEPISEDQAITIEISKDKEDKLFVSKKTT